MTPLLAATTGSPLWYLTRSAGAVSLLLLTGSTVLGIMATVRWRSEQWPRFVTAGLHRNVSVLALALLLVHIVTAVADGFAPIGWLDSVVPFHGTYRSVWLGLGAVAFDLLLALLITSAVRQRLGYPAWRAVHWLAYGCWGLAVVHGLGTGTDPKATWMQAVTIACVGAVILAVWWRVVAGWPASLGPRLAGLGATVVVPIVIAAWAITGPLASGWARRAGTPSNLLASSSSTATLGSGTASAPPSTAAPSTFGQAPFTATLQGTLVQSAPDQGGIVTVRIDTALEGAVTGRLVVTIQGRAARTEGVDLSTSTVTVGPSQQPGMYSGKVTNLQGTRLVMTATNAQGAALTLSARLQADPSSNAVSGTVQATPGAVSSSAGQGSN
ncbi:MAG TPA: ferric reductase-like transmembrane domain-containing protein [Acidimicrobiales bacterium]|nr:ferric reductase-like transmembrane domain-containing protein [Acidimicrobiales bacterium]